MSSSPETVLAPRHLAQLKHILHRSNDHYRTVAFKVRSSLTRTYHARNRALHLGLTVSTAAARKCPQTEISLIPLPVIEQPEQRHSPALISLPSDAVLSYPLRLRRRPAIKGSNDASIIPSLRAKTCMRLKQSRGIPYMPRDPPPSYSASIASFPCSFGTDMSEECGGKEVQTPDTYYYDVAAPSFEATMALRPGEYAVLGSGTF